MTNKYFIQFFAILAALFLFGCKKAVQYPHPEIDVVFTTTIDGYDVTFNNTTEGGVSYRWDFGDGKTSTEKSPTHTYEGKGKFVPTLYVTTSGGAVLEGSTVLRISKTSPVKLGDNSFEDWDDVSTAVFTSADESNAIRFAKFDYDATSVYFYVESRRTLADADILDIYIDADNAPSGYDLSYIFPGLGVEALIEGPILDRTTPVLFYYRPAATWDEMWVVQSITGYIEMGTIKEEGGLLKFEGKLDRTKLRGLTGTSMKLGTIFNKNDWSEEVGYIPDSSSPGIVINMSE